MVTSARYGSEVSTKNSKMNEAWPPSQGGDNTEEPHAN